MGSGGCQVVLAAMARSRTALLFASEELRRDKASEYFFGSLFVYRGVRNDGYLIGVLVIRGILLIWGSILGLPYIFVNPHLGSTRLSGWSW